MGVGEKDVAGNGKGNGIKQSLRVDTGIFLLVIGGCVQYPRQPGPSVKAAIM